MYLGMTINPQCSFLCFNAVRLVFGLLGQQHTCPLNTIVNQHLHTFGLCMLQIATLTLIEAQQVTKLQLLCAVQTRPLSPSCITRNSRLEQLITAAGPTNQRSCKACRGSTMCLASNNYLNVLRPLLCASCSTCRHQKSTNSVIVKCRTIFPTNPNDVDQSSIEELAATFLTGGFF